MCNICNFWYNILKIIPEKSLEKMWVMVLIACLTHTVIFSYRSFSFLIAHSRIMFYEHCYLLMCTWSQIISIYHIHQWTSTMPMSAVTAGWKGIQPRYEWVSLQDTKTCGLHTAFLWAIHTVLHALYQTACTIYSIYCLL